MPFTTTQRKKWATYAARTSMLDAARKFGVSATAIRRAMRDHGKQPRRPGAPGAYTEDQKTRAVVMVAAGKPGAEILRATGINGKYARALWRQAAGKKGEPAR